MALEIRCVITCDVCGNSKSTLVLVDFHQHQGSVVMGPVIKEKIKDNVELRVEDTDDWTIDAKGRVLCSQCPTLKGEYR